MSSKDDRPTYTSAHTYVLKVEPADKERQTDRLCHSLHIKVRQLELPPRRGRHWALLQLQFQTARRRLESRHVWMLNGAREFRQTAEIRRGASATGVCAPRCRWQRPGRNLHIYIKFPCLIRHIPIQLFPVHEIRQDTVYILLRCIYVLYTYITYIQTYPHTYIHTYIHTYTHTYISYIQTYKQIYKYIYM